MAKFEHIFLVIRNRDGLTLEIDNDTYVRQARFPSGKVQCFMLSGESVCFKPYYRRASGQKSLAVFCMEVLR